MDNMNVAMRGENAVPIVITHRTVTKAPEIERKRKFVGLFEGLKTLAVKAIELVEETFWEEEREVKDLGESKVVHYAIDIFHETDGVNDYPARLRVTQLPGNTRPACGAHFEVIKVNEEQKSKAQEVIRLPEEDDEGSIAPSEAAEKDLPQTIGPIDVPTKEEYDRSKFAGERPTNTRPRLPINRQKTSGD